MITDFYVAAPSAASKLLAGKGLAKLQSYSAKNIESVKLASLERLLVKRAGEMKLLTDEDAEQWVFAVSPALVTALAKVAKVDAIAKQWAATRELVADGFTVTTAREAIIALSALARQAIATQQTLLLSMSM